MLTVHVWTPAITKKGPLVGHASVTLGADYISWWPERGAFNVSPYRKRSLATVAGSWPDTRPTLGASYGMREKSNFRAAPSGVANRQPSRARENR